MTRRRSLFTALTLSALIVAACSNDDDPATTQPPESTPATSPATDPATTTSSTDAADITTTVATSDDAAFAYTESGPYPVGVTTLSLASGVLVEVWYPAVEGTTGEVSYDTRDFIPPAVRDLITADLPAGYTIDGARDASVAEGTFPIILRSHGFSGFRVDSSFLTSHLASWGFVVASPDHPSRDLNSQLGGTPVAETQSVDDLLQTLDLIVAEGAGAGLLGGHVDDSVVLATGHSAGGGTVLRAAADERVDGYVALASAAIGRTPDAGTTTTLPTLPAKPSFWFGGGLDAIAEPARTSATFELAPSPSLLWILEGAGHQGFTDLCTFGDGTGIIGLAEASGLGALLDAQPQFRRLGEDGCVPPALPVDETFPIILHAVTAWMRWQAGIDAEPVGLGPEVADAYATPVQIDSK